MHRGSLEDVMPSAEYSFTVDAFKDASYLAVILFVAVCVDVFLGCCSLLRYGGATSRCGKHIYRSVCLSKSLLIERKKRVCPNSRLDIHNR